MLYLFSLKIYNDKHNDLEREIKRKEKNIGVEGKRIEKYFKKYIAYNVKYIYKIKKRNFLGS